MTVDDIVAYLHRGAEAAGLSRSAAADGRTGGAAPAGAPQFTTAPASAATSTPAPSPGPSPVAKEPIRLGAYVGNGGGAGYTVPELLGRHREKALLGREPDYLLAFTGESDQTDYRNSVVWQRDNSSNKGAKAVIWSIPLLYGDRSLEEARDGELNADYTAVANALKDVPLDDEGQIKIRTGWEFNGDWFRWKTRWWPNDEAFKGAYRQFVESFRAVNPNFAFIWNSNIDQKDPELAYPGNEYVDFITMDFYVQQGYDRIGGTTPKSAKAWFEFMRTRFNGLDNLVAMGRKYGKPIGIDEWGVADDVMADVDMAEYVKLAFEYFAGNNFHHAIWWDGESGYPSEILGGKQPGILRAYNEAIEKL